MTGTWKLPKDAPKDGTEILMLFNSGYALRPFVVVVYWENGNWKDSFFGNIFSKDTFTILAWMPLPTLSFIPHECKSGEYRCYKNPHDKDPLFRLISGYGDGICVDYCPFCGQKAY